MTKRVIIIDDNADMFRTYRERFERSGYDVTTHLYQDDLGTFPEGQFDIGFLDGLEGDWNIVARTLEEKCNGIQIVVYSASPDIVSEAESAGYRAYEKPGIGLKNIIGELNS